jgi:hypothetical protein
MLDRLTLGGILGTGWSMHDIHKSILAAEVRGVVAPCC